VHVALRAAQARASCSDRHGPEGGGSAFFLLARGKCVRTYVMDPVRPVPAKSSHPQMMSLRFLNHERRLITMLRDDIECLIIVWLQFTATV
jgi:hypothetical protein